MCRLRAGPAYSLFPWPKTRGSLLHDESREPVRAFGLIGHRDDDRYVGIVAIGDECLVSVQYPAVALAYGRGAGTSCVRAGTGFGEAPRSQPLPRSELRDVFLFLLGVAGNEDVICAKRIMGSNYDADRAIDRRKLFYGQRVINVTEAGPAQFHGEDDAHEPHLAQLAHNLFRKLARLIPTHDVGSDFARGEIANFLAQLLLIFCQREGMGDGFGTHA